MLGNGLVLGLLYDCVDFVFHQFFVAVYCFLDLQDIGKRLVSDRLITSGQRIMMGVGW